MADALRFCVLGPLEVLHSGGVLRIRSGKQRAILVMMLLDANHVVSTDALVDGLWGEEPPPTAAAALQTHMAKLLRRLRPWAVINWWKRARRGDTPIVWLALARTTLASAVTSVLIDALTSAVVVFVYVMVPSPLR